MVIITINIIWTFWVSRLCYHEPQSYYRLRPDFSINLPTFCMKADLVVMSACQTAIGQIRRGDEIVGLTRAFLYAGSNAVLGSLWSVSDVATSVLMKEFYSNIKDLDQAEALRKAQLMMIRSERYNAPFYWAAFSMTGSLGFKP